MNKNKIIVALDVDTLETAKALTEQLHPHVGMFKVGMELFNAVGPRVVEEIVALGGKVFLDLKLHDIPTTVAKTCRVLTRLGASIINVHAAGGLKMMQVAAEAVAEESAKSHSPKPALIAVTVLTSIDQQVLNNQMNISGAVEEQVVCWGKLAQEAGLEGVVASPKEISALRQNCGQEFLIVTPGIRPAWAAKNDQKRIMTPNEAIQKGASYLVIGRPITAASNPVEATLKIVQEINEH